MQNKLDELLATAKRNEKQGQTIMNMTMEILRGQPGDAVTDVILEAFQLPSIKTLEQFIELNSKLCHDKEYLTHMVSCFKRERGVIVPDDEKRTTKKIMEKIGTYEIFKNYSWSGLTSIQSNDKEKLEFSKLSGVISLVHGIMQPMFTEPQITKSIKCFIKRVPQILSRRLARQRVNN